MTRRGKCRCGTILDFRQTSQGYKVRCESCGAIVRLRLDAPANQLREPKKSSSSVLTATGPPPLPTEPEKANFSADNQPDLTFANLTSTPPDLSILSEAESTAPAALAEMEAFRDPPARGSGMLWLVFALVAALVLAGVGVAAMMWG